MRRTHSGTYLGKPLLIFSVILFSNSLVLSNPSDKGSVLKTKKQSTTEVVEITWPTIVRIIDQHPQLAASSFRIESTKGAIKQARSVPNPSLEGTFGQGRSKTNNDSSLEWGLSLTIPLGWIVERQSKISSAEAKSDIAVAENQMLRREVLLQLRALFWELVYQQNRTASLEELLLQTAELTNIVQKRVDRGEDRPVEKTRIEIELHQLTNELETARITLGSRQSQLSLWLGMTEGNRIVASADLTDLPTAISLTDALAIVRESNPEINAARSRLRSLEADLECEKLARIPDFTLSGFTNHELDRQAYGVGVSMDLPIWNWNSGSIEEAEGNLAAGRKKLDLALRELEAKVVEVQAACHASSQTAIHFVTNVVPLSKIAASTLEKTYQFGEVNLLELIDARRTLLHARLHSLSALSQAQIDCSRLDYLLGKEPQ